VTVAESALERHLPATIMRGGSKPAIGRMAKGALFTEQGEMGHDIDLLPAVCPVSGLTAASSAQARSSADVSCWRMAAGPPPCPRSPTASSPPARRIGRSAFARLAEQHHREDTDR